MIVPLTKVMNIIAQPGVAPNPRKRRLSPRQDSTLYMVSDTDSEDDSVIDNLRFRLNEMQNEADAFMKTHTERLHSLRSELNAWEVNRMASKRRKNRTKVKMMKMTLQNNTSVVQNSLPTPLTESPHDSKSVYALPPDNKDKHIISPRSPLVSRKRTAPGDEPFRLSNTTMDAIDDHKSSDSSDDDDDIIRPYVAGIQQLSPGSIVVPEYCQISNGSPVNQAVKNTLTPPQEDDFHLKIVEGFGPVPNEHEADYEEHRPQLRQRSNRPIYNIAAQFPVLPGDSYSYDSSPKVAQQVKSEVKPQSKMIDSQKRSKSRSISISRTRTASPPIYDTVVLKREPLKKLQWAIKSSRRATSSK